MKEGRKRPHQYEGTRNEGTKDDMKEGRKDDIKE